MFMRALVILLLVAPAALAPAALAEEKPPAPDQPPAMTAQQCRAGQETCRTDCQAKHEGDEAKSAACLSVCSARYAACDAKAAYDRARPWLEETARKTRKFLEDLLKDLPIPDPDAPAPKPKTQPSI